MDMTAGTTQELRVFLNQCLDSTAPVTYVDRAGHAHQVFITQLQEVSRSLKRDEALVALTMIETTHETLEEGATGARAQEIFLLQSLDSTTPVEYEDRLQRKYRVFLTRLTLLNRVSRRNPNEWLYALSMVDAWGGAFVYELSQIRLTITTTLTLQTHTTDLIGAPNTIGFAQIGV